MITKGIHPSAVLDIRGEATVPDTTILEPQAVIFVGERGKLTLGDMFILYPNASIRLDQGWLEVGREVSFGPGVHLYEPRAGITIGNDVMIAGGTVICGVNHGHSALDRSMRRQEPLAEPIAIGDNVWIGMNCSILPGVSIGEGAIIGAGSVVTKDVPPNSINFGVPCRTVGLRNEND